MNSRPRAAAVLCSLALVGCTLATPTASATPRAPALAIAARTLAYAIIVDAYQVGEAAPSETAMVTAASCCGWTERHVFYRAAPGPYATYGGYELSVEEVGEVLGGVIRKVTVSEFPTTPQTPFSADQLLPATFSVSIFHSSLRLNKGWSGTVEYHYDPGCPYLPIPTCVATSAGSGLTGHPRLVKAVATQAMAVIERAHRHEPISAENPATFTKATAVAKPPEARTPNAARGLDALSASRRARCRPAALVPPSSSPSRRSAR
jgi:hypothetical protein